MSGYGGFSRDFIEGHGGSNVTGDEQSLLDSLRKQAAEVQALRDALALTAVELAEVRKERDRAVERLERAGIA